MTTPQNTPPTPLIKMIMVAMNKPTTIARTIVPIPPTAPPSMPTMPEVMKLMTAPTKPITKPTIAPIFAPRFTPSRMGSAGLDKIGIKIK